MLALALFGAVCGGAWDEIGRRGPVIRGTMSRSGQSAGASDFRLALRGGAKEGEAGGEGEGGGEAAAAVTKVVNDERDQTATDESGEDDDEESDDGQEMTKSPKMELLKHLGSKADPRNRKAQDEDLVKGLTHKIEYL